ncbi:uncharacterized protein LOC119258592 [Talpa occidentalis]|uniref:uncharacterized protein LOC119258592 n=1 Tax=Talpa occidentalis TaxID=50954 RepID=UPI00188F1BA6|nr:uncharacterized protein LOC119258592 [Talpa occidentalis]
MVFTQSKRKSVKEARQSKYDLMKEGKNVQNFQVVLESKERSGLSGCDPQVWFCCLLRHPIALQILPIARTSPRVTLCALWTLVAPYLPSCEDSCSTSANTGTLRGVQRKACLDAAELGEGTRSPNTRYGSCVGQKERQLLGVCSSPEASRTNMSPGTTCKHFAALGRKTRPVGKAFWHQNWDPMKISNSSPTSEHSLDAVSPT